MCETKPSCHENKELSPDQKKVKMRKNIIANYEQVEKSIVNQLFMIQDFHGTTIGTHREDIWRQLFEMIIPKKFVIEHSIFIIDSHGNISKEVDLAIIDETYTPYIFRYGQIKFVPIEAVSVVVECKSKDVNKDKVITWSDKIDKLQTSTNSIARIADRIATGGALTQKSTRPIKILCSMDSNTKPKNEDENKKESLMDKFDFIIVADKVNGKEEGKIDISYNHEYTLFKWFEKLNFHKMSGEIKLSFAGTDKDVKLNQYEVKEGEKNIALLSFNFQLNQLLMLINNPILFPHLSYVKFFNYNNEEEKK